MKNCYVCAEANKCLICKSLYNLNSSQNCKMNVGGYIVWIGSPVFVLVIIILIFKKGKKCYKNYRERR